jgi:hypothetical protein
MEPPKEEQPVGMGDKAGNAPTAWIQATLPGARLGALLAVGLAAFLIGWLVFGGDDESSQPASPASAASESKLREFAGSASHPVYWAGPRVSQTYELTRTSDGRVYVRYLPEGTKAGDPRPQFLTVGTYPRRNAFAELRRASRAPGAATRKLPEGGLMVFNERTPASVYFGYPDAAYQVEVFHPTPNAARDLVLAGQVLPVR